MRSRTGWIVLATVAPCALAAALYFGRWWLPASAMERIAVRPLNCRARHGGDRCDLPGDLRLRLFAATPVDASLVVLVDSRPTPASIQPTPAGRLVVVEVPPGARTVRVRTSHWLYQGYGDVDVRERREADWLRRARDLLYSDHAPEARQLLEPIESQESVTDPIDYAQAMSMLAQTRAEMREPERAIEGFRRARELDRRAGIFAGDIAGVLFDTICMTRLWAYQQGRFEDARRELGGMEAEFARYPEMKVWQLMQQGDFAWRLGDPEEGLRQLDESSSLARDLGHEQAMAQASIHRSNVLLSTGRRATAAEELRRINRQSLEPCRRANLAEKLAAIGMDARATPGIDGTGADETIDVFDELNAALELRAPGHGCANDKDLAQDRILLALAEVAFGDLDHARRLLEQSEREFAEPTLKMLVDQRDLHGQILLREERYPQAAAVYRGLRDVILARRAELKAIEVGDALWRSDYGLARAAGHFDEEEALRAFARTEGDLDDFAALLPFSARVVYLGAHFRGTASHLSLLGKKRRWAEVAEVIQKARLRAFLLSGNYGWPGGLTQADRKAARDQAERFHAERILLEQAQWGADAAPDSTRSGLERELLRLDEKLLNRALAIALFGRDIELAVSAPPPADEARLSCAGGITEWVCTAGRTGMTMHGVVVEGLREQAPPEEIERRIIVPLAPILRGARRLRILAHGAIGQVDFGGLRLDGVPLDQAAEVVYGVDAPRAGAPAAPAAHPVAVMVVDPRGELADNRAIQRLGQETAVLLANKYEVRFHEPAPPSSDPSLSVAARIVAEIAAADLLVLLAQGVEDREGAPWRRFVQTEVNRGLTLGDVLTLPRAPRGVMAIGCGLAISHADRGEAIGLAQSFALRGSEWVVGSVVDKVDPRIAAEIMVAFSRELLAQPDQGVASTARALARARRAVAAGLAPPTAVAMTNVAGFRVFVP